LETRYTAWYRRFLSSPSLANISHSQDKIGMFPQNFVQLLPDKVIREVNKPAFTVNEYRALSREELSFKAGEFIYVVKELEHGWSQGFIGSATNTGIFPTNLAKIVEDKPAPPDSPHLNRTDSFQRLSGRMYENKGSSSNVNPGFSTEPLLVDRKPFSNINAPSAPTYNGKPTGIQTSVAKNHPALPPGWQIVYLDERTAFYVDHNSKTTSWVPPMWEQNKSPTSSVPLLQHQLRPGWQQLVTSTGNLFFVDHNTRTTHWSYPYPPLS